MVDISDERKSSHNNGAPSHAARTETANSSADPGLISAQAAEFELPADADLPIHPAAMAFPVLPEQLDELVESLRHSGQMETVIVYDGKILDGQKRNLARKRLHIGLRCSAICDLAGLTPFEWAVRKNLAAGTARHLTDSQRALIGARLCREVYEREATARMTAGKTVPREQCGKAYEKAAELVNVRTNRLRQGLKVHDANWSELTDAVWQGSVVISTAAEIADLSNDRDRKRALTAATAKNNRALREILGASREVLDKLGQKLTPRSRSLFVAADTWNRQLRQLQATIRWLQATADQPEARVLRQTARIGVLEEVMQCIDAAKPWAQCPYCDHIVNNTCPVCQGSGFLTEMEYHANLERYASHLEQHGDTDRT